MIHLGKEREWYGESDGEPDDRGAPFVFDSLDEKHGYIYWVKLNGGWRLTTDLEGKYIKGLNLVSETNIVNTFGKIEYYNRYKSPDARNVLRKALNEELASLNIKVLNLQYELRNLKE